MNDLAELIRGLDFIILSDHPSFQQPVTFILDGSAMRDKEGTLKELSTALKLPHGMGQNYDSLDECLQPDFWPKLERLSILITHAKSFLTSPTNQDTVKTLLSIFEDSA